MYGEIQASRGRLEVLEAKRSADFTNCSKPPSGDNPRTKGKKTDKSNRKDRKKCKWFRHQALGPIQVTEFYPGKCSCGCNSRTDVGPHYVHQVVELAQTKLEVTRFVLHRGRCHHCGKIRKALLPPQHRPGDDSRPAAPLVVMAGSQTAWMDEVKNCPCKRSPTKRGDPLSGRPAVASPGRVVGDDGLGGARDQRGNGFGVRTLTTSKMSWSGACDWDFFALHLMRQNVIPARPLMAREDTTSVMAESPRGESTPHLFCDAHCSSPMIQAATPEECSSADRHFIFQ